MSRPAYVEAEVLSRRPRGFVEVDARGRTSLARVREQKWSRYAVEELDDGTLVLSPMAELTVAELRAVEARVARSGG